VGLPVTSRRVLRGGSWNNNQDNARAAYRNNNHPDNRNNNIGFRLCCSSHIFIPFNGAACVFGRCERCVPLGNTALPEMVADHGLRPEAKV